MPAAERPSDRLSDRRASAALNAVSAWSGDKATLRQEVKGLPVLVRRLGLAQAVALLNKGETRALASDLTSWLFEAWPGRALGPERGDVRTFLARYTQLPSAMARAIEDEGLRYAEALKLMSGGVHGP